MTMSMNETGIIWTEATWNSWSGCKKVSPGCKFCYAHTLAENKRGTPAFPNGFDLTIRKDNKFKEPLRLKEPALIFVNSMSDFFLRDEEFNLEPGTMDALRDRAIDVIEQTPHEYQVLTKRPDEMLRYSQRRKLPPNFWAGVSLDVQSMAHRLDILRQVDVEIRFVSAEPILTHLHDLDLSGIHWLIGGGESGNHLTNPDIRAKRSMADYHPKIRQWFPRQDRYHWAQDLRDQCVAQDVRFFWKQWGGLRSTSAGRELDGRTWDEFPRLPGGMQTATISDNHRLMIQKQEQLTLSKTAQ
jgi:protein gp37